MLFIFARMMRCTVEITAALLVAYTLLAGCKDDRTSGGSGGDDITLGKGNGDSGEEISCTVIDPDEVMKIVPEITKLRVNDTVSYESDKCPWDAELKGQSVDMYVTIENSGGKSAADWLAPKAGKFDEVRAVGDGAAIVDTGAKKFRSVAVASDGAILHFDPGTHYGFMPQERWEPLVNYLKKALEAAR